MLDRDWIQTNLYYNLLEEHMIHFWWKFEQDWRWFHQAIDKFDVFGLRDLRNMVFRRNIYFFKLNRDCNQPNLYYNLLEYNIMHIWWKFEWNWKCFHQVIYIFDVFGLRDLRNVVFRKERHLFFKLDTNWIEPNLYYNLLEYHIMHIWWKVKVYIPSNRQTQIIWG